MEETIPGHDAKSQIKTGIMCIVKEIIVLDLVTDGSIDVKTVSIVLDGIVLEGVYSASADVDAELAAIADAIPENGCIAAAPKTDARWAVINDITRDSSMTVSKNNSVPKTGIRDDVIGYLTEIRITKNIAR